MAHKVDILVGKRIRIRRMQLSMSQTELANKLGITFQQVQKYENGSNRVSCSRLYEIAKCLSTPITFFFSDTDIEKSGVELIDDVELSQMNDAVRLVTAFRKISSRNTRRELANLAESIASSRSKK
jgi:transcriptional regulator with XRE-family HTH domain